VTPPRDLSDTGKKLEAIREAVRDGLHERSPTPVAIPGHGDSSEHLRLIARDEVNSHERDCKGIERLERWTREMQNTVNEHSDVISAYLAEQKFKRFVLPVLIGFVGSAAGVGIMALVFRGLMQSMLMGMIKP
jgi:hypothetical protein